MVIGGTQRTEVWDDNNPAQRLFIYDRGVDRSEEQQRITYLTGDMVAPARVAREGLRTMIAEFASSIMEKRPPLTDGRAGLRVLAVLEAASESLRPGGVFVSVQQVEGRVS